MLTILVVVLMFISIGALPAWPYSTGWSYYPSIGAGVLLLGVIALQMMGRL